MVCVRKLSAFGLSVFLVLLVGVYLPRQGRIALAAAEADYKMCSGFVADYFDGKHHRSCMEGYLWRREEILWRYFFVQTLAGHL
jgi:hypothetical protein